MWIFFFLCNNCHLEFSLVECGDCWVDEDGNFGYVAHPGGDIIGGPKGKYESMHYFDGICLKCNLIYALIPSLENETVLFDQQPRSDLPPIKVLTTRGFSTVFVDERPIETTETTCPQCDGNIVLGFDLFHHMRDREKDQRLGLSPFLQA